MTTTERHLSDEFIHAGGGAGLVFIQLAALFPGLLPTVALGGLLAAVVVVPLIAVTLAGAVVAGIPWSMWRLTVAIARSRR
jgi:hypothetical protein